MTRGQTLSERVVNVSKQHLQALEEMEKNEAEKLRVRKETDEIAKEYEQFRVGIGQLEVTHGVMKIYEFREKFDKLKKEQEDANRREKAIVAKLKILLQEEEQVTKEMFKYTVDENVDESDDDEL